MLRLITIPISHFCEKARWALDRAGMAYREERHVQGIHMLMSRRAGGGVTVPVLVTPDGAIGESDEILDWVDGRIAAEHRLYPAEPGVRAQVERLCERFDAQLGPRSRRLMYVHMLREKELMLSFNNNGVPRWEDHTMRVGWPVIQRFARSHMDITPGIEVEDEAVVWREFDFVADLLADDRPYLAGERFGAADLTFAALAAASIVSPIYGTPLPQPEDLPADTAELVRRAREHPAGRFAMRMVTDHRREVVAA